MNVYIGLQPFRITHWQANTSHLQSCLQLFKRETLAHLLLALWRTKWRSCKNCENCDRWTRFRWSIWLVLISDCYENKLYVSIIFLYCLILLLPISLKQIWAFWGSVYSFYKPSFILIKIKSPPHFFTKISQHVCYECGQNKSTASQLNKAICFLTNEVYWLQNY